MFGLIIGGIAAVAGAVSTAAATIGTACSTIGGAIMTTVGNIGTGILKLGKWLEPVLEVINTISTIMGIRPAGEDPAELGLKAQKCGEKPEDYGSVEKYIAHLRNDIQLDKEELNKLSDADKVMCTAMGSALYIKNMEERYNMDMPPIYWERACQAVNSGNMSVGQLKNTMDAMKEKGVKNAESFSNYMDGKAGMEEQMVIFDSLKEAMHKEFPNLSDADLNIKVTHIKDYMEQDKQ